MARREKSCPKRAGIMSVPARGRSGRSGVPGYGARVCWTARGDCESASSFPPRGCAPFHAGSASESTSPLRRVAAWASGTMRPNTPANVWWRGFKPMPSSVDANHVHLLVVDPAGKAHGGQRVGARLHPWKYPREGNGVEVGWGHVLWRATRVVGKRAARCACPGPRAMAASTRCSR